MEMSEKLFLITNKIYCKVELIGNCFSRATDEVIRRLYFRGFLDVASPVRK